jgi:hypothetical protein
MTPRERALASIQLVPSASYVQVAGLIQSEETVHAAADIELGTFVDIPLEFNSVHPGL